MSFYRGSKSTILRCQLSNLFTNSHLQAKHILWCLTVLKTGIGDLQPVCATPVPLLSLHVVRISRAEDIHELNMPWQYIIVNDGSKIWELDVPLGLNP